MPNQKTIVCEYRCAHCGRVFPVSFLLDTFAGVDALKTVKKYAYFRQHKHDRCGGIGKLKGAAIEN